MADVVNDVDDSPPMHDGTIVLGVVLLQIALVAISVQRFPGTLWKGGQVYEFGSICALFAYAAIAYAVRGIESEPWRAAIRVGTMLGVSCTVIQAILHAIEPRLSVPPDVVKVAYYDSALLVAMFVAAALVISWRSRLMSTVLLSCVWLAVVSTTCSLLLSSKGMLLAPHFGPAALAAYESSGMTDPQAYVIRDALRRMPLELIIPLLEAALVGGIVGWFVLLLAKRKSREYVP